MQSTELRAKAEEAVEAVRQARHTLDRMRDVRIRVSGSWQQMDDFPEAAAEELRQRIAEVVMTWTADMNLLMRPAWQWKVDCHRAVDTNGIEMMLPAIWQDGEGHGGFVEPGR